MAQRRECGCDCGEFESDDETFDGRSRFKCACTKCGPEGRGCNVIIHAVAIAWCMHMRGVAMPSSLEELRNQPGFRGDCIDHNMLEFKKAAVIRARLKRKREAGHENTQGNRQKTAT